MLGVSQDFTIYVEELFDDSECQHAISLDGKILQTGDRLNLPPDLLLPQTGKHTQQLNFTGARHRGMREDERIQELVRPFTVETRINLGEELDIMPMLILGLAESYVLSEARLMDDLFVVCRRIRIAYALEQPEPDYDYDTIEMNIAHLYDISRQESLTPDEAFAGLPEVELIEPTDCIVFKQHLILADGGEPNMLHVWKLRYD